MSVRPRQGYNTQVVSFSATISAALFAFFRSRGADAIPAVLGREGRVSRVVTAAKEGRENDPASWDEALLIAHEEASIREAGERIPMYDPPGRQLALRIGPAPRMGRFTREVDAVGLD